MAKIKVKENVLELGWKVNRNMDPEFWLKPSPKPGKQKESDLVCIPANSIACHTAIIAQSGSGKSFFLGRLIEEILIKTKAKCIVLDPNADFRKIFEVESADKWKNISYKSSSRCDRLPTESSRQGFIKEWDKIRISVKSGKAEYDDHFERFRLYWPSLSVEFLAEDVPPTLRNGLYHCHTFTKAIIELVEYNNSIEGRQKMDFFDEAESLLNKILHDKGNTKQLILDIFKPNDFIEFLQKTVVRRTEKSMHSYLRNRIMSIISSAETAAQYITEDASLYYFGKARELKSSKIIQPTGSKTKKPPKTNAKLEIIDLPSFSDKQLRLLAINSIITSIWEISRYQWSLALKNKADKDNRVPTFIIIDEAHNLVPLEPNGNAEISLREQFRSIISEGRKYGIFLIVVTQRPDKIDPLILSECDNKVIMKLSTSTVLEITRKLLGLDSIDNKILEKCLEFELGRGILCGKWVNNNPQLFYSAARRTIEGGRNLRDEYWAFPDISEPSTEIPLSKDIFLPTERIVLEGPTILGTITLPEPHKSNPKSKPKK